MKTLILGWPRTVTGSLHIRILLSVHACIGEFYCVLLAVNSKVRRRQWHAISSRTMHSKILWCTTKSYTPFDMCPDVISDIITLTKWLSSMQNMLIVCMIILWMPYICCAEHDILDSVQPYQWQCQDTFQTGELFVAWANRQCSMPQRICLSSSLAEDCRKKGNTTVWNQCGLMP